ncbi:ammonium transporter [Bacillus marinisedimentorum]|uniref:ammonium transporter n=1 Tax=Bacillus marinisedimentorum TaxID=1821260 RepID=UPI0008732EC9|nr:ammonium transporter [Bacillus marinisedimentorum]
MKIKAAILSIVALSFPTSALAAEKGVEEVSASVDMIWMITAAILVFFMHAGFAMVETGFTRSKNSLNILMKNMLTIAAASILYFIVGFGLMFGKSAGGFIGTDGFALIGKEADIGFFVFQAVFAATCATIISGAVAERMKLSSYFLLTVMMTAFIYPVVGHWTWGGGWLAELGFVDFAGSSVVHLTGALGAIAAAKILGGRIGKYKDGKVNIIKGHNIPLGALGVFILWFGWFGFNGGSTLAADPELIPHVVTTTLLSASAAVVMTALYSQLKYRRIDASLTLNGALAGLVGITAGTADVSPAAALVIGAIAGIILAAAVPFIDRIMKIDDPVGAIAVHGVAGIWGTLAVGLFSTSSGLFYGGGAALLGVQAIGIAAIAAWTLSAVTGFLLLHKLFSPIRVSPEEEIAGLDFAEHGSQSYEFKDFILQNESPDSDSFGTGLIERLDSVGKAARTH